MASAVELLSIDCGVAPDVVTHLINPYLMINATQVRENYAKVLHELNRTPQATVIKETILFPWIQLEPGLMYQRHEHITGPEPVVKYVARLRRAHFLGLITALHVSGLNTDRLYKMWRMGGNPE